MSEPRTRRFFARHPSAFLLAAQLLGLLLYPFMEDDTIGRPAFEIFGIAVLSLAVIVVRQSPVPTWVVVVLGVLAAGLSMASIAEPAAWLEAVSGALHAAFYFTCAFALIAYMLEDHVVTRDELVAVAATFTLVAWGFAYLFGMIQILQPGSFTAAVEPVGQRTWMELLFLSFTNLSSTGLSDVVPIRPLARGVTMLEQLCGLAYLAVLTAYLVGLSMRRIDRIRGTSRSTVTEPEEAP